MAKQIPILYQAEMVRAYLAGHKTQTRRVLSAARCLVDGVGPSHEAWGALDFYLNEAFKPTIALGPTPSEITLYVPKLACYIAPRAQVGDVLWGRETWLATNPCGPRHAYAYRATDADNYPDAIWRPSIFMPRAASRISQQLTGVRIERLQDITEADALAEGVRPHDDGFMFAVENKHLGLNAREAYANLFDSINGPGSADKNPWVLVYEFLAYAETNARDEGRNVPLDQPVLPNL
jgi:hypothetical protein